MVYPAKCVGFVRLDLLTKLRGQDAERLKGLACSHMFLFLFFFFFFLPECRFRAQAQIQIRKRLANEAAALRFNLRASILLWGAKSLEASRGG